MSLLGSRLVFIVQSEVYVSEKLEYNIKQLEHRLPTFNTAVECKNNFMQILF
jgi:hypothetical protein